MSGSATSTFFTYKKETLPDPGRFPEADVLVLNEAVEYTLHPDGRSEKTVRRAWMYLTEFGRDYFSDVNIQTLEGRQALTVHRAATTMRDGFLKETPEYGSNEIVPFPLDRAPDLGYVRQEVVSLVGTEVGAVSVLEFTVTDTRPWKDFFWGEEPLGGRFPVLKKSVTIKVPKGKALAHAVRNLDLQPEISQTGEHHVWTVADLPAFDPEDLPPGLDHRVPAVIFSTNGSWPEVTGKLAGRFADASMPHTSISGEAEERAKDVAGPLEQALKIHEFVLEGVRTLDFHPSALDYTFRNAPRVMDSAYGTALEKGVLLASLAQAAGLNARLFLGMPADRLLESVAYPGPDASTWVEIVAGKRRTYFRPDKPAHEANESHLEEVVLVPVSSAGEPGAPKVKTPAGESDVKATLTLKPDLSLDGKVTVAFKGALNPYLRLAVDEKTTVEAFAGECASKLFNGAKAEGIRADLLSPDRTSLSFDLKGAKAERIGAFVSVTWPDVPKALHGYDVPLHRDNRSTSLALPASARFTFSLEIDLPKDARVRIPPPSLKRRGPAASLSTSFEEKDGKLKVKGAWEFPRKTVRPEEYEKFRMAVTSVANAEARSVLLEGI